MRLKLLPYFIGSIALAGCAYTPTKGEIDTTHASMSQDMLDRTAAIVPSIKSRPLVRHVAGSYLGLKSKPLGQDAVLPPIFKAPITLNYPGNFTLRQVAEKLQRATGLPVNLKPDVFLPVSAFISGGIGQGAGASAAPAGAAAAAVAGPSTSSDQAATDTMKLNFIETPMADALNQINAAFGVNFTYRDNEGLTFSRMVTRTFVVTANAGDTGMATSLGKSGGGGGGGGNGQGQSSGSANFSSTGTVTMNSTFSLWASLQGVVETIKTQPGKFFVNQATGTLTITDTKEVVDQVARYIETQNAITTTQVGVRVELLTITSTDNSELGVNLDAIFTKFNRMYPQWSVNLLTPATLASSSAGQLGMSILAPKDAPNGTLASLSGSQAMINAMQGYARVTSKEAFSGLTLNRQPATLAKTTQTAYLARTVPGGNAGTGSSTLPGLEPGQITTGFLSNVIPTVMDNGEIMMQFSIDSSVLTGIDKQATGSGATYQAIQTPQTDSLQTLQRVKLRSGGTLVLTGFERDVKQYNQRGITEYIGLGGSRTTNKTKESIVILITPVILDGRN